MSGFGYFQNGNEYVINKVDIARPQMNYIWNARVLSGVNHLGGGNGSYGDRCLAYIDPEGKGRCSVVRDGNRYFYVKNKATGKVFNPGWYPCRTQVEDYSCTHGLGYSKIGSTCDGIRVDLKVFANSEDPCEIWTVTVKNLSNDTKNLSVYSFAEFQLEGYVRNSDYNSYVRGDFYNDINAVICYNGAMERPHDWFNGYIASSIAPVAFETSKRAFYGVYGNVFMPDALKLEKLANGKSACEQMVGALQHDFELKAGEEVTYNVLIGAVDSLDTARAISKKLFAPGKIDADFETLRSSKKRLSEDIFIDTPDQRINNFVNYWLKQQVQLCTEAGRDGCKGFRDQLQDAWAIAAFNPALSKEKILETLTYMYSDGRCVRGWLPLNPHIYSDSPVWIAPTVNAYIKETGDRHFLNCKVKYLDKGEDTVWEHMITTLNFICNDLGPHGLVKARDGDWNDSLNMIGLKEIGESVWTSIALCYSLDNAAEIARDILGNTALSDDLYNRAVSMRKTINEQAWDGEWYLAAINDYNEKVGSHTEKEGKIYLNSQTWAILAGVAEGERKKMCLDSVDKYLDCDYGPLTLYPTYTSFNNRIGRLTSFIPGIWENGTPYCHGGTFKVVADCLEGRGNIAYNTISKILPDSKLNPSDHSGCEPYVVTNMYYGPDNSRRGETMNAWVTGTAGWMFRAVTQYMFGFHPGYDSFTISPCIPSEWKNISMTRVFRGDTYKITISNPEAKQSGISKIFVDGNEISGNKVTRFGDGKVHTVEILM